MPDLSAKARRQLRSSLSALLRHRLQNRDTLSEEAMERTLLVAVEALTGPEQTELAGWLLARLAPKKRGKA